MEIKFIVENVMYSGRNVTNTLTPINNNRMLRAYL